VRPVLRLVSIGKVLLIWISGSSECLKKVSVSRGRDMSSREMAAKAFTCVAQEDLEELRSATVKPEVKRERRTKVGL
jgi:hypothetical protein